MKASEFIFKLKALMVDYNEANGVIIEDIEVTTNTIDKLGIPRFCHYSISFKNRKQ